MRRNTFHAKATTLRRILNLVREGMFKFNIVGLLCVVRDAVAKRVLFFVYPVRVGEKVFQ